ncbi:MAG: GWxTD domain-containing protein, partial [Acidobacteriota bacterium]|nr:GWxTD domain-containing protein [Acidobacteriota bacterium]
YQRDAFIAEFWKARDPYPDTARNEFREHWKERLSMVRQLFENTDDERARYYLLNGPPGVHVEICPRRSATSIEAWFYGFQDLSEVMGAIFSRRLRHDQYAVIFYRRLGVGPWRAWYPSEELSISALQPGGRLDLPGAGIGGLRREDLGAGCKEEELGYALQIIQILNDWGGMLGFFYERMIGEKLEPIEAPSDEWLRTFESYSTKESRTVVQTLVQVEPEGAALADLAGARSYAFELIGEVLRADADTGADRLFESFRYRFEFPVEGGEATGETPPAMPLVAQRYLRPGEYKLILRVDDLNGDAVWRHAEPLVVPRVEEAAGWTEADLEPIFAEANRSLAVSGYLRFDTAVTGPVDKVRFTLDDKDLFTTKRAPYSVDVRLGELPRSQMLRAIAFDLEGSQIASDSYLINGSPHRFDVRIIEPIPGNQYSNSVRLRAQVTVPEGRSLEELQVFRNTDQVATLYEEPFTVPVELPEGRELAIIRIVGKLLDAEGPAAFVEDTAIINGPATLEEVQVDFVELYMTVDDRDRRPLLDLGEDAFQ